MSGDHKTDRVDITDQFRPVVEGLADKLGIEPAKVLTRGIEQLDAKNNSVPGKDGPKAQ